MKPKTQFCINERTGQIFPYIVNADFSTTFPPGVFLTYQDNFVAGFKDEVEARNWINRTRRPAPTYRDLEIEKQKGGNHVARNLTLV